MASRALTDIRKQLQRLVRIQTGKHWIVSCYLKLEPRDRSRGKYLIKLKNRIREVVEALPAEGLDRAETERVVADLHKLQATLQDPDALPASRGIAVGLAYTPAEASGASCSNREELRAGAATPRMGGAPTALLAGREGRVPFPIASGVGPQRLRRWGGRVA